MTTQNTTRAWAEVSADALGHNIGFLQQLLAPGRLMGVVKADAYGHGMALVAPLAARRGVTDFGVATVAEGAALRALVPEARLFVIALTLPDEAAEIVAQRLIPFISTAAMGCALADAARRLGTTAEAHMEVDTGIGRAGASTAEAVKLLHALDAMPGLTVTGLVTHFASADEDPTDAAAQQDKFAAVVAALGPRASTLMLHAANSPGLLALPGARYQMARPGLLLYGIDPAPGLLAAHEVPLRPVLSLKARVLLCRRLPSGASISYGRTYTVPSGGGVYATLGIGYGDGYPRQLSNDGFVLLHGRRAPLRGRVCMDQVVVDVTDVPGVRPGDVATLIGEDGGERITVGGLAARLETTPHEITTRLAARLPRLLRNTTEAAS